MTYGVRLTHALWRMRLTSDVCGPAARSGRRRVPNNVWAVYASTHAHTCASRVYVYFAGRTGRGKSGACENSAASCCVRTKGPAVNGRNVVKIAYTCINTTDDVCLPAEKNKNTHNCGVPILDPAAAASNLPAIPKTMTK